MGEIVAFAIGTRHVAVERVAREIYQQTNGYGTGPSFHDVRSRSQSWRAGNP